LLFDVIDLSQRDEGTGQAVRLSSRPVEQKSASIVIHGSWKPLAESSRRAAVFFYCRSESHFAKLGAQDEIPSSPS
jgi:hypothetical protein